MPALPKSLHNIFGECWGGVETGARFSNSSESKGIRLSQIETNPNYLFIRYRKQWSSWCRVGGFCQYWLTQSAVRSVPKSLYKFGISRPPLVICASRTLVVIVRDIPDFGRAAHIAGAIIEVHSFSVKVQAANGWYKPSIQTEEMLYNILWIQLNIMEMKISIIQINHQHNENHLQTSLGSAYRMLTSSILRLFGNDWKSSPRERQQYHRYNRVHCAPNQCFQFFPTAVLLSLLDRSYRY